MANIISFVIGRQLALSQGVSTQQATTDGLLSGLLRQPLGLLLALFLARNQAASSPSVSALTPTKITLDSDPPVTLPQPSMTFTATITPTVALKPKGTTPIVAPKPQGWVTFSDGGSPFVQIWTDDGTAVYTASLASGDHSITASYGGDGNYLGVVSDPLTFTVP